MALVAGFIEESPRHRFYNTAFYAEGGRIVHLHRKVYLPTYGLFDEQRYFAAGERFEAFDTARFGRVGILDLRGFLAPLGGGDHAGRRGRSADLPGELARPRRRRAADPHGGNLRTRWPRSYAQLMGAAVVLVNRVGFEDGLCFWGGSMAVGPDGRTIAQAPMLDEALCLAAFDPAELRRQRLMTPLARDERLLLTIEELQRIKRRRYES